MPDSPPDELMRGQMEPSDFDRVLAWLRHATSEDRVSFLCRWSHIPPLVTRLATSAVNHSTESLTIVVSAFDAITHANSQRTKHWCQFAVTKLGPRKALRVKGRHKTGYSRKMAPVRGAGSNRHHPGVAGWRHAADPGGPAGRPLSRGAQVHVGDRCQAPGLTHLS